MGKFQNTLTMNSSTLQLLKKEERNLILDCSRLYLDDSRLNKIKEILHRELDWGSIIFYSKYHSVASLLYRNLKLHNLLESIPRDANRSLIKLYQRTEYQNRIISNILGTLLTEFKAKNIPVIVLKGIALVEIVYGNLGLRPLIDINLLVRADKFKRAKWLLLNSGFFIRTEDPSQGFGYSQIHLARNDQFEIHILLQWHIVNWPRVHSFDMRSIWENAKAVELSGQNTLMLSPEDLMVYLCLQPDKHGIINLPAAKEKDPSIFVFKEWTNNRLIRYVDIYETLRHYREVVDFDDLLHKAKQSGVSESLLFCLHWVNQIMGKMDMQPFISSESSFTNSKFFRKMMYESLKECSCENKTITKNKSRFYAWWHKNSKLKQLHYIQILTLFEYTLPTLSDIKVIYRTSSNLYAAILYPFHMFKVFIFIMLPKLYIIFIKPLILKNRK